MDGEHDEPHDQEPTRAGYRAPSLPTRHFVRFVCGCGSRNFRLHRQPSTGLPERVCTRCWTAAALCDGERWRDPQQCACESGVFEIAVGLGVVAGDLAPISLGVRCGRCAVNGAGWAIVWSRAR